MEIADHGFNHEDFTLVPNFLYNFLIFYPQFTEAQQDDLLLNATEKIFNLLGVTPTTFVPPYNTWNTNTETAMQANGYDRFSSEVGQDPGPYPLSGQTFYHFPIGAQTSDQGDNGGVRYTGVPASKTWADIQTQLATYGYAAVMVHPMEYATWDATSNAYANQVNQTQLDQLELLIELVKNSGLRCVTLGTINTDSNFTAPVFNKTNITITTGTPVTSSTTGMTISTTGKTTTIPVATAAATTGAKATTGGSATTGADSVNTGKASSTGYTFSPKWALLLLGAIAAAIS
jgi:peptidoglycan/xylan/chitin deacetylase (PgdA/CDA1 family)